MPFSGNKYTIIDILTYVDILMLRVYFACVSTMISFYFSMHLVHVSLEEGTLVFLLNRRGRDISLNLRVLTLCGMFEWALAQVRRFRPEFVPHMESYWDNLPVRVLAVLRQYDSGYDSEDL